MKRFFLVMFGLALVAICAGWFVGLLDDVMYRMMGVQSVEAPSNEFGTTGAKRSVRHAKRFIGGLDLNTILNAANAVIGFVGLVVTYKASRGKSDTSSA